jgi:hypothetical protein
VKSCSACWGTATLTLDRYGHLFADELDAVADRLDDALRQTGVYRMCNEAELRDPDRAMTAPMWSLTWGDASAPGRIRTCDTRFREGMVSLTADIGCDLRKLRPEVGETRSSSRAGLLSSVFTNSIIPVLQLVPLARRHHPTVPRAGRARGGLNGTR